MGRTRPKGSRSRTAARALIAATLAAGALSGPGAGAQTCAAAPDEQHCPVWTSRYDNPNARSWGNFGDRPAALALSPLGDRVFLTGSSSDDGPSREDYATAAFDLAGGAPLWASRYNKQDSVLDLVSAIGVSPDGARVYVTGSTGIAGIEANEVFATLAYDAARGEVLWTGLYDGAPERTDWASDLVVSPDGSRVYVTGRSTNELGDYDYATVAYDAATGAQVWATRYDTEAHGEDVPTSIAVGPDGSSVYVTGYSLFFGWSEHVVVAFDTSGPNAGAVRWHASYRDDNFWNFPFWAEVAPDGKTVFVAGSERVPLGRPVGFETWSDFLTIAYDAETGAFRWSSRYTGPYGGLNVIRGLALDPDGARVYVTGSSSGIGLDRDIDWATVAYDAATGEQTWVARYARSYKDDAWSIAVRPEGDRVYVAGSSTTGDSVRNVRSAAVTIAYDASTGDPAWTAAYDPPTSIDRYHAMAVATVDGMVVTAGSVHYGLAPPPQILLVTTDIVPINTIDYLVLAYED